MKWSARKAQQEEWWQSRPNANVGKRPPPFIKKPPETEPEPKTEEQDA